MGVIRDCEPAGLIKESYRVDFAGEQLTRWKEEVRGQRSILFQTHTATKRPPHRSSLGWRFNEKTLSVHEKKRVASFLRKHLLGGCPLHEPSSSK